MDTYCPRLSMQKGFTKLFNTIVTSTIWSEDDKTRIIWITMLAICDRYGDISASVPGLAKVANVSVESTEKALANLMKPDPYSRTKDHEGRRIMEIDGGWHVYNYEKYRDMLNAEERRQYKALKEQERRDRIKANVDKRGQSVDKGGQRGHNAEAECREQRAESKEEGKKKPTCRDEVLSFVKSIGLPEVDGHYYFDKWESNGYKNGGEKILDWRKVISAHKSAGYCPSQKRNLKPSAFQSVEDSEEERKRKESESRVREKLRQRGLDV